MEFYYYCLQNEPFRLFTGKELFHQLIVTLVSSHAKQTVGCTELEYGNQNKKKNIASIQEC